MKSYNYESCHDCCYYNEGDGCELPSCIDSVEVEESEMIQELGDKHDFRCITDEMFELYQIKNRNYGNSFSKQYEEYGLTSVCIRLEDKLNRLKSLTKQMRESACGITDVFVDDESVRDTLIDLANYSVLAIMELDK